jgi:hypothetical protein
MHPASLSLSDMHLSNQVSMHHDIYTCSSRLQKTGYACRVVTSVIASLDLAGVAALSGNRFCAPSRTPAILHLYL